MRLVFLISVPFIFLAIAIAGAHILVERLFILIAVVMLFSFVFARVSLIGLKGQLKHPGQHNQAGQQVPVEAAINNQSFLPKAFLKFKVHTSQKEKSTSTCVNLPSGDTYHWKNYLSFSRRGYYRLGPLDVEASDPFGLFRIRRKLDPGNEVLIYPKTVELPYFWAEAAAESGSLRNNWLTDESSGVISGVREYVPGDALNRIHWRSTAHLGKLIVKEFDLDASDRVWIIPDLCKEANFGSGMESTEEYTITIAASLAKKYAESGRQVGLIAQGKDYHFSPSRTGLVNMWHILEILTGLNSAGQVPISRLLSRACGQFSGNSVVVIITTAKDEGLRDAVFKATKQGIQVVIIGLDSESFTETAVHSKIDVPFQSFNVPIYVVKKGDDLETVLNSQGRKIAVQSGIKVGYLATR